VKKYQARQNYGTAENCRDIDKYLRVSWPLLEGDRGHFLPSIEVIWYRLT
jgi:hypothetical protein